MYTKASASSVSFAMFKRHVQAGGLSIPDPAAPGDVSIWGGGSPPKNLREPPGAISAWSYLTTNMRKYHFCSIFGPTLGPQEPFGQ